MKLIDKIKDERGFALVLSLVVMAAMTAIGIAAVMTSTTDMLIARNDREAKTGFFLAESGIEEAIGRMDLAMSHARYVGESFAERQTRIAGTPTTFAANSCTSAVL
ncbi:MAG: pilus assembly PilX N-terminal domain-containing protein, partial [Deltaproteobacteria bacterium]|nr:pilus assembly PilX N-terminal domain-containing protein [Deltaproteobacteria bacterium]